MATRRNRYRIMERQMTLVLLANLALFILYLLCAGSGNVVLKFILGVLSIMVGILCLGFLRLTGELLKKRSFWMSVSAASIVLCTLVSLLLGYPG